MNITFAQVDGILKTLPISYYVKRKLDVELSKTSSTSYCDIMNDKIVISFSQLENTANKITHTDDLEADIRCLLYHETSHAYLTPLNLPATKLNNIFEDERIESLLRHYYKHVDFRSFVKRVNNYHDEEPISADDMFYQVVRYRKGPVCFTDKVSDIICKYKHLNRNTQRYTAYSANEYTRDIQDLYDAIENYFYGSSKSKLNQLYNNDVISSTDVDNVQPSFLSDEQAAEYLNKLSSKINKDSYQKLHEDSEHMTGDISSELSEISSKFYSKEVLNDISMILSSVKNMTKHNGSAINAYSGKFDPRSVIRDDYKYFIQQNRIGHVKAFAKLHLNLFIDCSGSFEWNDLTTNKLLYALTRFEKSNPNFSFDLISCGYYNTIRDKNDRVQHSSGGNRLGKEIFDLYRKVQLPQQHNVNIVMFDGDAFSDFWGEDKLFAYQNFAAFNGSNNIIISDRSNQEHIQKYCPLSKHIFTNDYSKELYKNVISSLQVLCKN